MRPSAFPHPPFAGHELIDSGEGEKLERFGDVVLRRPDPQAIWPKRLAPKAWGRADLRFERESDRGGRWASRAGAVPHARAKDTEWELRHGRARFSIRPTPFKHVGLFPEQAANWALLERTAAHFTRGGERPELLNLFGYTGAASVLAALAGWRVTHVDASKTSVAWTRQNAEASGCDGGSIRYVTEDAPTFVEREGRRGNRYAGVMLDPPHYGRGPKGQKWQLEDHLAPLVQSAAGLLPKPGEGPALMVLSMYAVGFSGLALENLLRPHAKGAELEVGELALPEGDGERLLPAGFCGRWVRED